MKPIPLLIFLFLLATALLQPTSLDARLYKGDVVVLVEESIASPIKRGLRDYITKHYTNIILIFADYQEIAKYLGEADIIITSNDNIIKEFALVKGLKKYEPSTLLLDRLFLCVASDSFITNVLNFMLSWDQILKVVERYGFFVLADKRAGLLGMISENLAKQHGFSKVVYVGEQKDVAYLISHGRTLGIVQESYVNHCCVGKITKIAPIADYSISYKVLSGGSEGANTLLSFLVLNRSSLFS